MTLKKQVVSFVEYIVQSDAKENSPFYILFSTTFKGWPLFLVYSGKSKCEQKLVNPQNMSWPQHKHSRFWKLHK